MKTETDGYKTVGPPSEPAVAVPRSKRGTNGPVARRRSAVPSTHIERRRAREPSPRSGHDRLVGLSLIGPNLTLFTVFVLVPIVGGLLLSLTTWDITNGLPKWVGLANYRRMFADPLVWRAVLTTLKFIVFGVVPTVVIGLGLAMLINVRFRFVGVVRSLYLIPAAMSFAASAVVWRYIFLDGPGFGVLDYVISRFGVTPPDWLASQTWALPALDIITVWLSLPAATILYLAALQRIPDSLIEAAALDGAGPWRRTRYVIWPGVRYMTVLVAIVALLSFTNGSFDLVNILTKGDPLYATQTLVYYIFVTGFGYGFFGYAAALSVLQVALIGGILFILWGLSKLSRR
jgi:multiple sugar transport system permease protein